MTALVHPSNECHSLDAFDGFLPLLWAEFHVWNVICDAHDVVDKHHMQSVRFFFQSNLSGCLLLNATSARSSLNGLSPLFFVVIAMIVLPVLVSLHKYI